jgi:hypothetical protein
MTVTKYIKKTVLFRDNEMSRWVVDRLQQDARINNRQLGPHMAQLLTDYIRGKYKKQVKEV